MNSKELFDKYSDHWEIKPDGSDLTKSVVIEDFDNAIKEYTEHIISLIDEMVKEANTEKNKLSSLLNTAHCQGEETALINLKRKIIKLNKA